jgi:hypothetical protein
VSGSSRFDLVVFVDSPDGDTSTTWVYNPNLFDASSIARLAISYEFLLKKACADPEIKVGALFAALEAAEKELRGTEQKKLQQTGLEKLKKVRRKAIEGL